VPKSVDLKRTSIFLALAFAAAISPLLHSDEQTAHSDEKTAESSTQADLSPDLRRPVALTISGDQQRIYVANRNGSVSTIDWESRTWLAERTLGDRFSDIVTLPDGRLLVADEQSAFLMLLEDRSSRLEVVSKVETDEYPVFLCMADVETTNRATSEQATKSVIYVSFLWPRRIVEFEYSGELTKRRTVDLPFSPRNTVVSGKRLLAADAYGNQLAIVNRETFAVEHVREFPGHNLRGMLVTPSDKLVVAHQMLNELAHSVRNDVHWGLMMSNDLRWLEVDAVIDSAGDLYKNAHMHPLGDASDGTADPAGVAMTGDGRVVVTLGGVGEVAVGVEEDFSLRRAKVGRRPTDVIVGPDDRHVIVANTFDDSISFVDTLEVEETARVSLGPMRKLTMTEKGELLFYDASLSHDQWMSCHSCHPDGHTNGLRNDNFSDKSFGAPKRVLSLLGNRNTAPFAWSGKTAALDDQIRSSIMTTMQSDREPTLVEVEAIRNFLWSFTPPPPVDEMRGNRDEQLVAEGKLVFTRNGCADCHVPPRYTSPESYDVGLVDEQGNSEFNPPSLRGVSQRSPYFHDNRAKTLDEVIGKHRHRFDEPLKREDARRLIAFLRSL
jgi:DNA-binding beta-propeller fold protein YncE